jgi:hypothetical protein
MIIVKQNFPSSCHILGFRPTYIPDYPILEFLQPLSIVNIGDQVSHPYATSGELYFPHQKVIQIYIICLKLLFADRKQTLMYKNETVQIAIQH